MASFHVNNAGNPGPCSAQAGGCPFGGDSEHYTSPEAARSAYEKRMEGQEVAAQKAPKTLEDLKNFTTEEATEFGYDYAINSFAASDAGISWEKLMGKKNRTAKAIEYYKEQARGLIDSNPELSATQKDITARKSAETSYARAYALGIPIDPDMSDDFDDRWEDNNSPYGEFGIRESARYHKENLEALEAGEISASSIIGGGYRDPKKTAVEYLENQIKAAEQALRTKGRSHPENVRVVERDAARRAEIKEARELAKSKKATKPNLDSNERDYSQVMDYELIAQADDVKDLDSEDGFVVIDRDSGTVVGTNVVAVPSRALTDVHQADEIQKVAEEWGTAISPALKGERPDHNRDYLLVDLETSRIFDLDKAAVGNMNSVNDEPDGPDYYELLENKEKLIEWADRHSVPLTAG